MRASLAYYWLGGSDRRRRFRAFFPPRRKAKASRATRGPANPVARPEGRRRETGEAKTGRASRRPAQGTEAEPHPGLGLAASEPLSRLRTAKAPRHRKARSSASGGVGRGGSRSYEHGLESWGSIRGDSHLRRLLSQGAESGATAAHSVTIRSTSSLARGWTLSDSHLPKPGKPRRGRGATAAWFWGLASALKTQPENADTQVRGRLSTICLIQWH